MCTYNKKIDHVNFSKMSYYDLLRQTFFLVMNARLFQSFTLFKLLSYNSDLPPSNQQPMDLSFSF